MSLSIQPPHRKLAPPRDVRARVTLTAEDGTEVRALLLSCFHFVPLQDPRAGQWTQLRARGVGAKKRRCSACQEWRLFPRRAPNKPRNPQE